MFLFESMMAMLPWVTLVKNYSGMEDRPDRGLLTRHRTLLSVLKNLLVATTP